MRFSEYLAGLAVCAAVYLCGGCSGLKSALQAALPAQCQTERGCEVTLYSRRF